MNRFAYQIYEMAQMAMAPARAVSDLTRMTFKNPANPLAYTSMGRNIAASAELFERVTRRYGKPAFDIETVFVNGQEVAVSEETVLVKPFCHLVHFARDLPPGSAPQSRLLIVAPMSGHYATLLRGTVEAFLQTHDVYITDWVDARVVPLTLGKFDLDDYVDYVVDICEFLSLAGGTPFHVLAVCQPSVPVLAAVARMEAEDSPHVPVSMTLKGGPIDTRRSPTAVNKLAEKRGSAWFRQNCIHLLPFPYPGAGRYVYPGFLQLSGFMAMNFDRHVNAHLEMFNHLVENDGDSAEKHREFYDEYLAVMDLTAEFYLQTIDTVFVHHALPKGQMTHKGEKVDLTAIRRVGLLTVEGEKDDISGVGQTHAAQELCSSIPESIRLHHLQADVGHYGVFNGSRFRKHIAPRVCAFHKKVEEAGLFPS
ncbi:poly(3-hydroxybutyrate) depolymerase [Rhodoblastus acidophilus]|uniref:Poly(3-hydroxybutyrate) depolymerase n=1 Tax=Rhodoblastus acidophilus TaxID=1074 RepID=A0A212R3Y5_RHOAC|nr:polyhydroxyalkanoate depolymerase [Rhodoblastus acidophilus]MCW2314795.1 poly(3-hydroxybutyrate) depolymerase [Rhodoblastus acidophilus]PPQ40215.1 polyhydroxyalkanoate depolymerase [Rhodoblastus acidophilus]RAI17165.1 polyhydroxyalkanoate depolymerase [Rhodoblastus acidophilus]SNB66719.1 poly(3-hydroxybutyrate) depolymerase [Rhodoblastus acidophilus]